MAEPTYKKLIDLLEEAEASVGPHSILSTADVLTATFSELFPHVKIGRPGRFLETVRRLQAPLRSGKLKEDDREMYLKRLWMPRTRNITVGGE